MLSLIQYVRLGNLTILIREHRGASALGRKTGDSPERISHLSSGYKGMGEVAARKIEGKLSLTSGWMDRPHAALNRAGSAPTQEAEHE
jgi:hypothetical protein